MNFTDKPLLVIGDLILDEYLIGTAIRLSPEAPVPVVNVRDSEYRLGGACNVAANIRALGGNPICIGVLGDDDNAHRVAELFRQRDMNTAGLIRTSTRRTTTKTRVMVNRQQIARLDKEDTHRLDAKTDTDLNWRVSNLAKGVAAVIVSDYAKGLIAPIFMTNIVAAIGKGTPIFIDPKVSNSVTYFGFEPGVITCMTPNQAEARGMSDIQDVERAGTLILRRYGCKHVLVTRGEDGMTLLSGSSVPYNACHLPTTAQDVFDVSGAGDTVIAALALAYASGFEMLDAAKIANAAAGIVVGKSGTATVSDSELAAAMQERP